MGCDGYEAILKDVPAAALVRELEAHLLECPACARKPPEAHVVLVAMTSSVEAALRVEPSADFLARVRQHVAEERARPAPRRLRWLPALAASVAIAVALVVAAAARRRAPSTVAEATPAPVPAAPVEAPGPSGGSGAAPPASSTPEARRASGATSGRQSADRNESPCSVAECSSSAARRKRWRGWRRAAWPALGRARRSS